MQKSIHYAGILLGISLPVFGASFPPRNPRLQAATNAQAKVAYPTHPDSGRIWVKGDEQLAFVTLRDPSGSSVGTLRLEPPNYTGMATVSVARIVAEFRTGEDKPVQASFELHPPFGRDLAASDGNYSLLLYGCFQPFTARPDGTAELYAGEDGVAQSFFEFFGQLATGRAGPKHDSRGPIRLLVGTGDQVYVDAGYQLNPPKKVSPHPLSAWETAKPKPQPLVPKESYAAHLNLMYREFHSFRPLADPMLSIPQVGAWDDHDIRDGWGSHGDEYRADGTLDPFLGSYYEKARAAYIEHQVSAGPRAAEALARRDDNRPLHQIFTVGGLRGFALDLRSTRRRDAQVHQVLDREQKEAFRQWLTGTVKPGETIVIVSSMPLFLKNNKLVSGVGPTVMPGDKDDLGDGFDTNSADRDWLLGLLLERRLRDDVRPVFVSGDYHKSAATEIWYYSKLEERRVFGYEILATGLYHEGIAQGFMAKAFKRIESQRVGGHRIELKNSGSTYTLDPFVKHSIASPNFALLTTDGTSSSVRIYLPERDDATESSVAAEYTLRFSWDKLYNEAAETTGQLSGYQRFYSAVTPGYLVNVKPLNRTAAYPLPAK